MGAILESLTSVPCINIDRYKEPKIIHEPANFSYIHKLTEDISIGGIISSEFEVVYSVTSRSTVDSIQSTIRNIITGGSSEFIIGDQLSFTRRIIEEISYDRTPGSPQTNRRTLGYLRLDGYYTDTPTAVHLRFRLGFPSDTTPDEAILSITASETTEDPSILDLSANNDAGIDGNNFNSIWGYHYSNEEWIAETTYDYPAKDGADSSFSDLDFTKSFITYRILTEQYKSMRGYGSSDLTRYPKISYTITTDNSYPFYIKARLDNIGHTVDGKYYIKYRIEGRWTA